MVSVAITLTLKDDTSLPGNCRVTLRFVCLKLGGASSHPTGGLFENGIVTFS